jgi:hypothetical protein
MVRVRVGVRDRVRDRVREICLHPLAILNTYPRTGFKSNTDFNTNTAKSLGKNKKKMKKMKLYSIH